MEDVMDIPPESYLPERYLIGHDPPDARIEFFKMAHTRIRFVDSEEFYNIVSSLREDGRRVGSCGYAFIDTYISYWYTRDGGTGIEKYVNALSIWICKEHFLLPELLQDFSDLIPVVIEHELWETWINARWGLWLKDLRKRHLLARRKELQFAVQNGLDKRLFTFMATSSSLKEEYEYASSKIRRTISDK